MESLIKSDFVTISIVNNPFNRHEKAVKEVVPFISGKTVNCYINNYLNRKNDYRYVITINGKTVDGSVIVHEGDYIVVCTSIEFDVVAIFNLFQVYFAGTSLTSLFAINAFATIATGVVVVGASYAINAILAPSLPDKDSLLGFGGNNYGFDPPVNNTREGDAIPVLYGRSRIAMPILITELETAETYTNYAKRNGHWFSVSAVAPEHVTLLTLGNNIQFMDVLLLAGEGEIKIGSLRVNESPIESFAGVEWEMRNGANDQDPMEYFNPSSFDQRVSSEINVDGSWVTVTTVSNENEGLEIGLSWPTGFYGFSSEHQGGLFEAIVTLKVEYRPNDITSYEWVAATEGNVFYLRQSVGVDPQALNPELLYINNIHIINPGTIGALDIGASDSWGYGQDAASIVDLGDVVNTVFVHLSDNANPDSKAAGYVQWDWLNFGGGTNTGRYTEPVNDFLDFINSGERIGDRVFFGKEYLAKNIIVDPGIFINPGVYVLTQASRAPFRHKIKINNIVSDKYDVRIKMISKVVDTAGSAFTEFEYLKGIIYDNFSYPNVTLLGIRFLATSQLSGRITSITAILNRQNVSIWADTDDDGIPDAFVDKPANNPAWAAWDILYNETYGGNIDKDRLIFSEFEAWANFCIANILECNIYFEKAMNLSEALITIGNLGRATVVQRGYKYGVIIDSTGNAVQLFTVANIIKDSFEVEYLPKTDIANAIEITYWDKDDDWNRQTVEIQDTSIDVASTIIKKGNITLYGCTLKKQAQDFATILINGNRLQNRAFKFEAALDSIACEVGDVIKLQHDVPQYGFGGRAISGSDRSITIDRELSFIKDNAYEIFVRDGTSDTLETQGIRGSNIRTDPYEWILSPSSPVAPNEEYYLKLKDSEALGAAQFTAANNEFLSIVDPDDLDLFANDVSISAWVYVDSFALTRNICSKYEDVNNFWILNVQTSGLVIFAVKHSGTVRLSLQSTAGQITVGNWHHIVAIYDRDNSSGTKIFIDGVDDTDVTPATYVTSVDFTGNFYLGQLTTATNLHNGRMASIGKWDRLLTATEISYLYNSGKGRVWGDIDSHISLNDTDLKAWWDLSEASGLTRVDSKGSNDLADNNTVTQVVGILAISASNVLEPTTVYENDSSVPEGSAGSLGQGAYDYNDIDSLGYNTIYICLSDGTDPDTKADGYVEYDWTTVLPHILYLTALPWTTNPIAEDLYAFGIVDSVTEAARITNITSTDKFRRKISTIEYDENVYDLLVAHEPAESVSLLVDIEGLTAKEAFEPAGDGTGKSVIYLSWRGSAITWAIYVRHGSGQWSLVAEVSFNNYRYDAVGEANQLQFSVSARRDINSGAQVSVSVLGKALPPADVLGFVGFQKGDGVILSWTNNPDFDLSGYEIRVGATWEGGFSVASDIKSNTVYVAVPITGTYIFHIKAVDLSNNVSDEAAEFTLPIDVATFINLISLIQEISDVVPSTPLDGTNVYYSSADTKVSYMDGLTDTSTDFTSEDDTTIGFYTVGEFDSINDIVYSGNFQPDSITSLLADDYTLHMDSLVNTSFTNITDLNINERTDKDFVNDTDTSITNDVSVEYKFQILGGASRGVTDISYHGPVVFNGTGYIPFLYIKSGRQRGIPFNITEFKHILTNEIYPNKNLIRNWMGL